MGQTVIASCHWAIIAFHAGLLGAHLNHPRTIFVRRIKRLPVLLLLLVTCLPAAAELSPAAPDPLARIREAAKGNAQTCSATGESLCEQVAPRIIENAM